MTAYLVTIRPGSAERYTDSIWIEESSAKRRVHYLLGEFDRRGRITSEVPENGTAKWSAWVSECGIEDASLDPKKVSK